MFKYRLYPNKTQTKILEGQLEICRIAHNRLLDYCKQQYKEKGKIPSQFDLNNLLIILKQLRHEFSMVYSQVLQNIAKRIKDAYTGFFARRLAGLNAGLPRFKKQGTYKSITYPQSGFKVYGKKLYLSKIGDITIKQHRELSGQVKTLTIKRMPSGKWYACFSCIVTSLPTRKPFKDVGIDVGLNNFAVLSDGTLIENPRFYRKSEKRLANLQRVLSRRVKGSKNRLKTQIRIARSHEKIGNQRNDFLHKTSRKIVDNYDIIYIENLKIRNMVRNHSLAKSISDAGWGRFIDLISYKAESAGGQIINVDPRNTTQNCSQCGNYVNKTLSNRVHECPYCGLRMDRDHNAALNILARGREIRREQSELKPEEEKATTLATETVQAYPVRQESSLLVER